jgi:serine/threonine protein phosphatase PrpC
MGYCYTRSAGLFALTDGMGGHPEGEVAAQLALQSVAAAFQEQAKPSLIDPSIFLREAIFVATSQLLKYARQQASDRFAAHHLRGLRAAGWRPALGPLR